MAEHDHANYGPISLRRHNGDIIWQMNDNFSLPLAAGIMTALIRCMLDANNYQEEYPTIRILGEDQIVRNIDENFPDIIVVKNFVLDSLSYTTTMYYLDENIHTYSIWVHNGYIMLDQNNYPAYNLYWFEQERELLEFLQGIITICDAFNVSVKDLIPACPIYNEQYYHIDGINLPLLPLNAGDNFIYPLNTEGTIFPAYNNDNENDYNRDDYEGNDDTTGDGDRVYDCGCHGNGFCETVDCQYFNEDIWRQNNRR